jgi:hypothetical protein
MSLRERWDRLSKHPTWSTVIGGLILAGILATLAQIWNLVRAVAESPPGQLTTQLGLAWHWLSADVPIPRGVALLGAAIVNVLLFVAAWYWLKVVNIQKRLRHRAAAVKEASEQLLRETRQAAAAARENLARAAAEETTPELEPRVDPPTPPRLGPPPLDPFSELEDALLMVLASEYPDSVELRDLPARLERTSLVAEQVADDLEGRGFVKVNRVVGYGSTSSGSVALTPAGRKLCIEKGLDLLV